MDLARHLFALRRKNVDALGHVIVALKGVAFDQSCGFVDGNAAGPFLRQSIALSPKKFQALENSMEVLE